MPARSPVICTLNRGCWRKMGTLVRFRLRRTPPNNKRKWSQAECVQCVPEAWTTLSTSPRTSPGSTGSMPLGNVQSVGVFGTGWLCAVISLLFVVWSRSLQTKSQHWWAAQSSVKWEEVVANMGWLKALEYKFPLALFNMNVKRNCAVDLAWKLSLIGTFTQVEFWCIER